MRKNQLTIITSTRHVVPCTGFVTSELVPSFGQGPLGPVKLDHARLEVMKWSVYEA